MWGGHDTLLPTTPKASTTSELELVDQIQHRLLDLHLSDDYLQPKNLVRFIRARSGSLNQAEVMIRKNLEWMRQERISEIFEAKFPSTFETYFPWKVCGLDDYGGPIVVIQAGFWDPAAISGMKNDLVRYFLQIMEKGHRFIKARCGDSDYFPQFSFILDCEGLGWKHYLSYDGIQATVTALRYFEANYPDSLRLGVAVNCPSVLNMIWKIVRPFVAQSTQAKLRFLYEDDKTVWAETLTKYFPQDRFPVAYGGTAPDSYKISLDTKPQTAQGDENGNKNNEMFQFDA